MRFLFKILAAAALVSMTGVAQGAEPRIGLAAPLDGNLGVLGRQMRDGANAAVHALDAELVVADDRCTAEGGETAARSLAARDVRVVVGFLCTEAIEAALPILGEAGIPVITPAVRTNGLTDLRERNGWLVWRLAPRADAEAAAVADILVPRWRNELFAIIDDGTIYGRELAESFRLAVETAGLEPVFVDTFRPQSENQVGLVGRLRRAGATHVFVGGDREDIAIMARDAGGLDYGLTIAGGEAMRAAGELPLPDGTLMIALPEWSDMIDEGVVEQFTAEDVIPEGYVLPTYAAVEIAAQAAARADADGVPLSEALSGEPFQTMIGTVSFDAKGDLSRNPFQLYRHDGERFLPVE